MIAQGGSDTFGMTPRILKALLPLPETVRLLILLGPGYRHHRQLERVVKDAGRPVTVFQSVRRMTSFLKRVDFAVTGAGILLYELACLGIPSAVITGEPRELETAGRCERLGFTRSLGLGQALSKDSILSEVQKLIFSRDLRKKMGQAGRRQVDGRGSERIVDWILRQPRREPCAS